MRRYARPVIVKAETPPETKTTQHPNIENYMKHERGTATQTKFKELLFERLKAMGFVGEILCDPTYVFPLGKGRYRLRRPDFVFVGLGLLIECDGAIHDVSSAKARRDFTRDLDWKQLGYVCYRFGNEQIHDPRSCIAVLNDIEALIRNLQSIPTIRQEGSRRRTRSWRARKDLRRRYPSANLRLGTCRKSKPRPSEFNGIRSYKLWDGLAYCFYRQK